MRHIRLSLSTLVLLASFAVGHASSSDTPDMKPTITVKILEITDNAPFDSYNVHYEVTYTGASSLTVSVEEEYGSRLSTKHYSDPSPITGVADHITAPFRAWIDFSASNEYGKTVYTVMFHPYGKDPIMGYTPDMDDDRAGIDNITDTRGITEIIAFDLTGHEVFRRSSPDNLPSITHNGILILRYYSGPALVKTVKIASSGPIVKLPE